MPSLTEIVEGVVAGIAVLGAGAHTLASKKGKREKGEEEDGEKARTRDGKFLLGEIIRERGQWKALRKEQRSLAARIEDHQRDAWSRQGPASVRPGVQVPFRRTGSDRPRQRAVRADRTRP